MTMTECLVLNASWIPIQTVGWQEAFTKIFNGRAYAVDFYEEVIKTPSDEYLKPAVIVLASYNKIPVHQVIYSKRRVLIRDNYLCQYCSEQLTNRTATIDHVVPTCKGGRSTFENTVTACSPCNSKKGNKSLREAGMKLRQKPKKPKSNPIRDKFYNMKIREQWKVHLERYVK